MGQTAIGLVIGLAGTLAATRVMASMLYGVGVHDPLTIAVVAGVLSAVAGLACFVPARRIASVDPVKALRS
jgi:ABC-type antimicrobial peptide transport system permease subunit